METFESEKIVVTPQWFIEECLKALKSANIDQEYLFERYALLSYKTYHSDQELLAKRMGSVAASPHLATEQDVELFYGALYFVRDALPQKVQQELSNIYEIVKLLVEEPKDTSLAFMADIKQKFHKGTISTIEL